MSNIFFVNTIICWGIWPYTAIFSVVLKYLNKNSHIQAYRGSRGIAPIICIRSSRWKWVVYFTTWLLFCQGRNQYTLNTKLVCLRAGLNVLTKRKTLPLPGFKPRFIQSVAYSLYHIDIQLQLKLYNNRQTVLSITGVTNSLVLVCLE
jgi:hypothetical protein